MAYRYSSMFKLLPCAAALWCSFSVNASVINHQDEYLPQNEANQTQTDRIIVKWKQQAKSIPFNGVGALVQQTGMPLEFVRNLPDGSQVFQLPSAESTVEAVEALSALPQVASVELDPLFQIARVPNDARFNEQWNLLAGPGGLNLPRAWDITIGSKNMIVAVVDTGVLPHADLRGKILPGYDFISDPGIGNDGDGRDKDATDPGDWIVPFECSMFQWQARNSSWHGTHVSGTIAAKANNDLGIAGIAWNAKILPVRVLGKCGGYMTDIIDGIRWAAGLKVAGAPVNHHPAKVINLSLGGMSPCGQAMQTAIKEITKKGAILVVAAGNDSKDASVFSPANCAGVVTVAANNREGDLAFYSNFGKTVEIMAPGGEIMSSTAGGILSSLNEGATVASDDSYAFYQGTSMATPHVAGVVALMASIYPNMKPSQVAVILKKTARKISKTSQNACESNKCGPGILDAGAAVKYAQRLARQADEDFDY